MNNFPAPSPGTSATNSRIPRPVAPFPTAPTLIAPVAEPSKPGNWVGAIAAAIAMQIAAAMAVAVAFVIVVIAAFASYGDSSATTPGYIVLSLPIGIGGIVLFILSGRVASRIAQDRRGWLMLIAGPLALAALRIVPIFLGL